RAPWAKALSSSQLSQSCAQGFLPVARKLVELKPRHSPRPRSASVALSCQVLWRSRTSLHLRRFGARVRASRVAEAVSLVLIALSRPQLGPPPFHHTLPAPFV